MKPETFVFEFTACEIFLLTNGLDCLSNRETLLARIASLADRWSDAVARQIIAANAQNLIATLTR